MAAEQQNLEAPANQAAEQQQQNVEQQVEVGGNQGQQPAQQQNENPAPVENGPEQQQQAPAAAAPAAPRVGASAQAGQNARDANVGERAARPSISIEVPEDFLQHKVPCFTDDEKRVDVEVGLLLQSNTFKNMWQDLGISKREDLENFEFPVTSMSASILNKVVEWLKAHVGIAEPIIEEDPVTHERKWFTMTDFETRFFDVDVEVLAELIAAGNFLDIRSLYYYGCQSLAALIKDKTPEQVRDLLGLEDDLTEEEKEEIRRKNVWCQY